MSGNNRYKPGDIVIGEFPYTDKEQTKARPFLIIATPHPYYWGVMITSSSSVGQDDGSAYEIKNDELDFLPPKQSSIRMNVIQTIDPKVIRKKIGRVKPEPLERVVSFITRQLPTAEE